MYDHPPRSELSTADSEIKTALYYRDEFAGLQIVWRIGPAVLLGALSWAGILYLVLK